jgi:hypothetical protein
VPARSLSAGGTLRPMDPSGSDVRPLAASAFRRRSILVGTWLAGSAWEGWAIYTAFMARSENPSTEVAVALAASTCWMPVVGTCAAVMAAVWAWDVPWWGAVAMFVGPRLAWVLAVRMWLRRLD